MLLKGAGTILRMPCLRQNSPLANDVLDKKKRNRLMRFKSDNNLFVTKWLIIKIKMRYEMCVETVSEIWLSEKCQDGCLKDGSLILVPAWRLVTTIHSKLFLLPFSFAVNRYHSYCNK